MSPRDDVRRIVSVAVFLLAPVVLIGCRGEPPEIAQTRSSRAAATGETPVPPQPSIDPPGSRSGSGLTSSDGTLASMVESALLAEPETHSAEIAVSAVDGTVFLRGKAKDRSTRRLAAEIAGTVDGVRRVQNELFVSAGS